MFIYFMFEMVAIIKKNNKIKSLKTKIRISYIIYV